MLKEFKKFALKGSMIDLSIGIIIGGAFNTLVNSLVNDIFMPILSIFTNKINFNNLFISLDGVKYETLAAAQEAEAATINYGLFISGIINFVIMAFVVFLIVRWVNKLQKPEPKVEATTKKCPHCLSDIDIKATKCAFCTSDVAIEEKK
ncbi:MAG TPA: large conductance mechanosensitive channel protein MscL [Clostridiales bacterium]|nr:large conductance mechanosensitive channel protein MscL [Clostridiales bacterium]